MLISSSSYMCVIIITIRRSVCVRLQSCIGPATEEKTADENHFLPPKMTVHHVSVQATDVEARRRCCVKNIDRVVYSIIVTKSRHENQKPNMFVGQRNRSRRSKAPPALGIVRKPISPMVKHETRHSLPPNNGLPNPLVSHNAAAESVMRERRILRLENRVSIRRSPQTQTHT